MGKGDKKTKRGKIIMGSYGVRRSRNKKSNSLNTPVAERINVEAPQEVTQEAKPKPKAKAAKKTKEVE